MNCISQICCFHVALISCLAIIRVYHIFVSISTCALREEGDSQPFLRFSPPNDFYPRPPRGGRLSAVVSCYDLPLQISIHALREEGDAGLGICRKRHSLFLSTPSARRATAVHGPEDLVDTISIHALREEGDSVTSASATRTADFYPRPPRGGRPSPNRGPSEANNQFLSTPSARRATYASRRHRQHRANFYPRPPRGGRLNTYEQRLAATGFLSTPSARRATTSMAAAVRPRSFLSTPSARRATTHTSMVFHSYMISIHALREEDDSKNRDKISIFKQIIQHSARI